VQELFRLERRTAFMRLLELLFVQSGGMFEASSLASPCEVSRATISNYVAVLEATRVVHVVRPFSGRRAHEIIAAPKVYAFDTGFVCHQRGWDRIREDDKGLLWEHLVLNELHSRLQSPVIRYWRDKRRHEVDFVLVGRGQPPVAIECKWKAVLDPTNLRAFRHLHPKGANWVVSHDVDRPFTREIEGLEVEFLGLSQLAARLADRSRAPRPAGA
jgi:predicted AAA+ superfamily ATPase